MLSQQEAQELALKHASSSVPVAIYTASTIEKPYGWIFFWDSKEFIETRQITAALADNGPILVNKFSRVVIRCDTSTRLEAWLRDYEVRLAMDPETARTLGQWPHKWFGAWRESHRGNDTYPQIREFVSPELVATYDKSRLREYLTTAQVAATTSRNSFPNPFTGKRSFGSLCWRTDGVWLWLDDLPDYIEQHDVALPDAMLSHIEGRGYRLPRPLDEESLKALEWPAG